MSSKKLGKSYFNKEQAEEKERSAMKEGGPPVELIPDSNLFKINKPRTSGDNRDMVCTSTGIDVVPPAASGNQEAQLRQMLDNAPIVTSEVDTNSDIASRDKKSHANHDDLPRSDDSDCGTKRRQ
jgi:hypothetical protein